MADDVRIDLGEQAIRSVLNNPECVEATAEAARAIADGLTSGGAGFKTERTVRDDGTQVGGKSPLFRADARRGAKGAVGLVWTANYAAAKYNAKTNAMLKARG